MDRYVQTTTDPILAARRTVNGLLVSVAGLVAVAVANELVIVHHHGQTSVTLSLLLFGGPLLYLLSQTVYLWLFCPIRGWAELGFCGCTPLRAYGSRCALSVRRGHGTVRGSLPPLASAAHGRTRSRADPMESALALAAPACGR
jgi:hypothetical protein